MTHFTILREQPILVGFILLDLLSSTLAITTIHHNKPYEASIPIMASNMKRLEQQHLNVTLPPSERHKRLLPYMNFYLGQSFNQPYRQLPPQQQYNNLQRYRMLVQKQNPIDSLIRKLNELARGNLQRPEIRQPGKIKYTPFTETNALPGPFIPIKPNQQFQNTNQPNFNEIYDKLAQLKYAQQNQQQQQQQQIQQYENRPVINYLPDRSNQEKFIQPTKTIIQTYTATEVDIPPLLSEYRYNYDQDFYRQTPVYPEQRPIQIIGVVNPQIQEKQLVHGFDTKPVIIVREKQPLQQSLQVVQQERDEEKQRIFEDQLRIYEDQQQAYRNEQKLVKEDRRKLIEEERKNHIQQIRKPLIYAQNIVESQQSPLQDHRHVNIQYQEPAEITVQKIQPSQSPDVPVNRENEHSKPIPDIPLTTEQLQEDQYPITESPGDLGEILRNLQASNTLPQNLTPENIDHSIKTLVRILNVLKKHQRLSKKPIIVPDQAQDITNNEAAVKFEEASVEEIPGTVVQTFPADTTEGGTPGKAGIDYPALSSIPQTSFSCKTQRYKGFFGDPDTHCQVWHYCDFNGGQASFLCPNGTIFSQVALTCDWWYNVKCSSTPQLYVLNERLYKYILPFSPKFPEDYSGPLVDRYLALKFQEMEEKMKKQRKKTKDHGKDEEKEDSDKKNEEDIDDADQLQKKNEENLKMASSLNEDFVSENNIRRAVK